MQFANADHRALDPDQEISHAGEILSCAAATYPDKTGFICGKRSWTFREMDQAANRFAHFLHDEFDGQDGPVAIIGPNCAEYALTIFGTARSGRCLVNLHTRNTPKDLADAINLTGPVLIIAHAACRKLVAEAIAATPNPPHILDIPEIDTDDNDALWASFANHSDAPPTIDVDPDRPATIIFTGGTTGRPKAVVASHRARAISVMAAVEDFHLQPDEIGGYSVPLTHAAGMFSWFQPAVLAGCSGILIPKWDVETVHDLVDHHQISILFAVPAQLALMLDHPAFDPGRLRSLNRMVFGGAPISRALIERAEKIMPWLSCERAYGSSETGHMAAQSKTARDKYYDGMSQPGGRLEIEIFSEPGIPAAIGEVGEVATRGPHLMSGYLNDPNAEAEFFKTPETVGDWGWTGDLALKQDGYFTLVGRSKHMILSGGLNIYPAELEEVLNRHPDVKDCAVIGLPDDVWGELPVAAIVPERPDPDFDAITDYVAASVANYKKIRRLVATDHIPRTISGKIDVDAVRDICVSSD